MKTCKGCGNPYRSGTVVFLLTASGLKGVRACSKCAASGITIVATKLAPVVQEKSVKPEIRALLAPIVRTMESQTKALKLTEEYLGGRATSEYLAGKIEGLETALTLLKRTMS